MSRRAAWKAWLKISLRAGILLVLGLSLAGARVQAAGTFVVNTNIDSYVTDAYLSLREALLVANGTLTTHFSDAEKALLGGCTFSGASGNWTITGGCGAGFEDTITFSFTSGVILLNVALPALNDSGATIIQGPTGAADEIAIDGTNIATAVNLLDISSNNNQVTGHLAFRNGKAVGISISSNYNTISGVSIYGNATYGLAITSGGHNTIVNSELGLRSLDVPFSCTAPMRNISGNILLQGGAQQNTLDNNTAVCSSGHGITLVGSTTSSNTITYNDVGTWYHAGGLYFLPNNLAGIALLAGAHHNQLTYNLLAYNQNGILVNGIGTDQNVIDNNNIGKYLLANVGNTLNGVVIEAGAQSTQVTNNLIARNHAAGVSVTSTGFNGTLIENNQIFENTTNGIILSGGTANNTLRGNTIYSNGAAGIQLAGTTNNNLIETGAIYSNAGAGISEAVTAGPNLWRHLSIYKNSGLGIDRLANGLPTPPYATISSFTPGVGGTLTIQGHADPFSQVELYRLAADPSGFGEGQAWVGSAPADAAGNWQLTFSGPGGCFTALQYKSTATGVAASEFGPNTGCAYSPVVRK